MPVHVMSLSTLVRTVPYFKYPEVFGSDAEHLLEIVADVGRRGAFILQSDLATFERRLAAYLGVRYVVGVANATDGLHLAIRAAGIGPGDEVIFCSHTMVATPAAVHFAGAIPIPVECHSDHLIDPAAVEKAITCRTRAILPTQLNGRVADMDQLQRIADEHGLLLIEDAAQALGARYRGRPAGSFGLAGAVSFYPAKTLGCLGDGGCVITNDDKMYEQLLCLRDHGRGPSGEVEMWGLNSRLDNLQAAILNHKLDAYDQSIADRRRLAAVYQERLGECAGVRLPPAPDSDPQRLDIFQNYEVEAQQRDALRECLRAHGVGTLVPWGGKAVHQFAALGFRTHLPFTDVLFRRLLMLPMNPWITEEDVHHVCDVVQSFYEEQLGAHFTAA